MRTYLDANPKRLGDEKLIGTKWKSEWTLGTY